MQYISVKTYANLTNLSERTVRRYIATHTIDCCAHSPKNKTRIAIDEVEKNGIIPLANKDLALIIKADDGDALAQNDVALLLLEHLEPSLAIYWLTLAAKQNCADAMQLLGHCHATGNGTSKDMNQSMMWISKAAALGNIIASQQMDDLFPHS